MKKNLKIDHSFISTWHPTYDEIEKDEAEYHTLVTSTNADIRENSTISEQTFKRILNWKSPRVKGIVRFNEFNVYKESIRAAHNADENNKLKMLLHLYGVGAPVASTILHFMYPDAFPIIDIRTTETLHYAGRIEYSSTYPSRYASFRTEMLKIVRETSYFNLREIDRALFAYHKISLSRKLKGCIDKQNVKRISMNRERNILRIKDKVSSVLKNRVNETFKRAKIIDLVVNEYPGTKRGSVIPTDYCYNSVNKDAASFNLHIFESLGNGTFKCLGLNANYSGPIYWKRKKVGKWEQGKYQLWKDPRK